MTTAVLPAFVPQRFREPILRSAARWSVSAALLAGAADGRVGLRPDAGSPAGAQGIAQFMPATAAAYGLGNPFDPVAAIDAEAHLMSDLLRQFGSPELALAAYNAGPGAVAACNCIPPYPETQAYVTRILALLGSAGALALPSFEVRLVAQLFSYYDMKLEVHPSGGHDLEARRREVAVHAMKMRAEYHRSCRRH